MRLVVTARSLLGRRPSPYYVVLDRLTTDGSTGRLGSHRGRPFKRQVDPAVRPLLHEAALQPSTNSRVAGRPHTLPVLPPKVNHILEANYDREAVQAPYLDLRRAGFPLSGRHSVRA